MGWRRGNVVVGGAEGTASLRGRGGQSHFARDRNWESPLRKIGTVPSAKLGQSPPQNWDSPLRKIRTAAGGIETAGGAPGGNCKGPHSVVYSAFCRDLMAGDPSKAMFESVEGSVRFPAAGGRNSASSGRTAEIYEKSLAPARAGRGSSSTKAPHGQRPASSRPLPDPGDQGPVPSLPHHARISRASARRVGTRTGCRSRSKSAKSWASTPRKRSKPSASNRSSTAAWKASFAIPGSGKC